MLQRLDATTIPEHAIQGTAWYNILCNKRYTEQFEYFGADVQDREIYIKDGKGTQQSDMVMILLNLAAIPDQVVQSIDLNNFSESFQKAIETFKQEFSEKQGKQWTLIINEQIKSYLEFKLTQSSKKDQ